MLAGSAEGFALLPALRPRLAAVVHPGFTEPEAALRAAGVPVVRGAHRRGRRPPAATPTRPRRGGPRRGRQPDQPDRRAAPGRGGRARWPRPGGWCSSTRPSPTPCPGEPESLAGGGRPGPAGVPQPDQDLGAGRAARRLRPRRPRPAGPAGRAPGRPWPVSTPRAGGRRRLLHAGGRRGVRAAAERWSRRRAAQAAALAAVPGVTVLPGVAPYLLLRLPAGQGERVRAALRAGGIAVRRGDTFPGPRRPTTSGSPSAPAHRSQQLVRGLAAALAEGRRMTARLADVIAALEAAYPPALAADWDAVGLVCGDPGRAGVDRAGRRRPGAGDRRRGPRRGAQLLVTHHPLLLRGVHGVGADTPKGALLHRLIRAGTRAVHRAHQRRRRRPRRLRRAGRRDRR